MNFTTIADLIEMVETTTNGQLVFSDYFNRYLHRLPIHCHSHCTTFCSAIKSEFPNPGECSRFENRIIAQEVQSRVETLAKTDQTTLLPFCKQCYAGVVELCMPIVVDGELLGRVVLGPFRLPDHEDSLSIVRDHKQLPRNKIPQELREKLPLLSRDSRKANSLLLMAFTCALEKAIKAIPVTNRSAQSRSGTILNFLNRRYFRSLQLTDVARQLHLSPSRTAAVIKEEFGESFTVLLQQIRLSKSCELLASTKLPVSEIARMCGFPNPNYLFRLFKRKFGITPESYRKREAKTPQV